MEDVYCCLTCCFTSKKPTCRDYDLVPEKEPSGGIPAGDNETQSQQIPVVSQDHSTASSYQNQYNKEKLDISQFDKEYSEVCTKNIETSIKKGKEISPPQNLGIDAHEIEVSGQNGPEVHCRECYKAALKSHSMEEENGPLDESMWADTLSALEKELTMKHEEEKDLLARSADKEKQLQILRAQVAAREAEIEEVRSNLLVAEKRVSMLSQRCGAGHVRRDDVQVPGTAGFPSGDALTRRFREKTKMFDAFSEIAEQVLMSMLPAEDEPLEVLIMRVFRPLHELTLKYLTAVLSLRLKELSVKFGVAVPGDAVPTETSIVKQFWLLTQQKMVPAHIDAMGIEELRRVYASQPFILQLERRMTGDVTVPQLVRSLLHMHALALLSDPRCYVEPWPGTTVLFKDGHTEEVFQWGEPGVSLREGEPALVVRSGLYFEPPSGPTIVPAVPSGVRRMRL